MIIKKIFIISLALIMSFCIGACKTRTSNETKEKQRGARENVVISENSDAEESLRQTERDSSSQPESRPEKDTVPEEMTSSLFHAATSGDRAKIQQFADYNTLFKLAQGQEPDFMLSQVLVRLKYEILSSSIVDDKATVTAKVSNVDMGVVMPLFYEKAMKTLSDNAANDKSKTAEELEREYRKIFVDLMTEHEKGRVERIVEVELNKIDGKWEIKSNSVLGDTMLGGYLSAQDNMRGDMQTALESTPEISPQVSKASSSEKASSSKSSSSSKSGSSKSGSSKSSVKDDEYKDIILDTDD